MKLIDLGWCIGKLEIKNPNSKIPRLVIMSPGSADDERFIPEVFIPASSITIHGAHNIIALRDALNEAYPE